MPSSPLRTGALVSLAALAFAGVVGLIAVLDADSPAGSASMGVGLALLVFALGATLACALACLSRGRVERVALGSVVVTGLALDLASLGVWLEIDDEVYGKVTAIASWWALLALVVLGLTLAVGTPGELARYLYLAEVAAAVAAGLVVTWLVATLGDDDAIEVFGSPLGAVEDEGLLRALGAALVLLATLWFAALAASRLERATR